jgi:hypothetical protein
MTRVLARRTLSGFVPADDQAAAEFKRLEVGKVAYIEIKAVRNPRQHRMLFAALNMMVEHAEFPNIEAALLALKLATGHVDYITIDKDGTQHMVPRSINYANMTKGDWEPWFDSALKVIAERWLPGVKSEELRAELEQMVAG